MIDTPKDMANLKYMTKADGRMLKMHKLQLYNDKCCLSLLTLACVWTRIYNDISNRDKHNKNNMWLLIQTWLHYHLVWVEQVNFFHPTSPRPRDFSIVSLLLPSQHDQSTTTILLICKCLVWVILFLSLNYHVLDDWINLQLFSLIFEKLLKIVKWTARVIWI